MKLRKKQAGKAPTAIHMGADGYLAIDPGIDGTGWAAFPPLRYGPKTVPITSNAASPEDDGSWGGRCSSLIAELGYQFRSSIDLSKYSDAYIEEPEFQEGRIAAVRHGSLVKLSILSGMLAQQFEVRGLRVHWIPVHRWKGSMPKSVTALRVAERVPGWFSRSGTTHEMDAVGLGLYVRGAL